MPASFDPDDLADTAIDRLQDLMSRSQLTAAQLTTFYLDRIERLDRSGPAVNSVLALASDALDAAAALDRERAVGRRRGPLHGVPILLKDNLDTRPPLPTTAGSLALAGTTPPRDSTVAERLRAAGAVVLGKANLSEWANFRSSRSSSGWSAVGGQTRNPHALDRNPGGSSSGSAAAPAAGLCAAAIGTETDGSIVFPASVCGVVGLKPTVGLVSRAGIVPIADSQDTAGPMARTVTDAALLLDTIAGPDPRDAATSAIASRVIGSTASGSTAAGLDPAALRGARLGVARNCAGFHERVDALFEDALAVLRDAGAVLVDPADVPHKGDYGDAERLVLLYEFKDGVARYLATRPGVEARTLADLIAFNLAHADREMPFFQQETFLAAQAKGSLDEPEYVQALETCRRLSRAEGLDAVLAEHHLDALVAPTSGPAPLTDLIAGARGSGGCSQPAAVAGYPHLTVPMGQIFSLPVGLSFFGPAFSDPLLLRLGFAFEQATHHRRPPRFLATAPLAA